MLVGERRNGVSTVRKLVLEQLAAAALAHRLEDASSEGDECQGVPEVGAELDSHTDHHQQFLQAGVLDDECRHQSENHRQHEDDSGDYSRLLQHALELFGWSDPEHRPAETRSTR